MRVGVIGLGRMGRFYAQTIASLPPAATLAAVADQDPRVVAAVTSELGVEDAFTDPMAIIEQAGIDAVVIATPTSTHADLVIAAAHAGKPIFCEKPLALSLERTRAAHAAAEEAGVQLQVGFMRRFDPPHQQAKALIDAGRIGRPLIFRALNRDPSCPPVDFANPAFSGGLVVDMGVHDFDVARWFMSSEVERVSADGALLLCEELARVGDIDTAFINLRFANGMLGNIELTRDARYTFDIRSEVLGSEGAVMLGRGASEEVQLLTPPPPSGDSRPHFVRRFEHAYRAQIEHFIDCVQHQRQPLVGGGDALAAFEIAHAATLAWQRGAPVELSELRERAGV